MPTTPQLALRYPAPSEYVTDGANAVKRLADDVEANLLRRRVLSVLDYGAIGDDTADDTAAIDETLAALALFGGGVLLFPGGLTYLTDGGHVVPADVVVRADGASIHHVGDNTCLDFNAGGEFRNKHRSGMVGGHLIGNAGAGAVGIEAGNMWGWHLTAVEIEGYALGTGLLLSNVAHFLEGTSLRGVRIQGCLCGLRFRRSTGTESFAYTYIHELSINVIADGIGIDLGGDSASLVYLYNSIIQANIWLEGNNGIAVRVGANFNSDNNRYHITGEIPDALGLSGVSGLKNLGGTFKGYGHVNVKDGPNDLALGTTRVLAFYNPTDSASGTDAGRTFEMVATANPDVGYEAAFGFITGAGVSSPFAAYFDSAGNEWAVYAVPFGQQPADGSKVLSVGPEGVRAAGLYRTDSVVTARGSRTSGNLALTSTAWDAIDSAALDCIVDAVAGDVLRVDVSALWNDEAVAAFMDIVTVVAGSVVNHISGAGPGGNGLAAWRAAPGVLSGVGGSTLYTVQAGDIDAATVRLRLLYKVSSSAGRAIYADANMPLVVTVQNLG